MTSILTRTVFLCIIAASQTVIITALKKGADAIMANDPKILGATIRQYVEKCP